MSWYRTIQVICMILIAPFVVYEYMLEENNSTSNIETQLPVASIGIKPGAVTAYVERLPNRQRRVDELSHPYPFYTISPRYYYVNSPYHQTQYSYYDGFRYFYPNYGPPTYYYGSPYTVGLSLQFDREPDENVPTTLTPQDPSQQTSINY